MKSKNDSENKTKKELKDKSGKRETTIRIP